jgi:hypothetical protein
MTTKPTAPSSWHPARARLLAALGSMPDEAFEWAAIALSRTRGVMQIWPDGLGGFTRPSQAGIEAVRDAADALLAADPPPGAVPTTPHSAAATVADALAGLGCLGRSAADEPVFVLCARDRLAAETVRAWIDYATARGVAAAKLADAADVAREMDGWRERAGGGKVPD